MTLPSQDSPESVTLGGEKYTSDAAQELKSDPLYPEEHSNC